MSTMRENLVDHAIDLVRVRGYAGFSYADLSDAVGIRKPSIHHHFPTKEDLGEAIVAFYSERFFDRLAEIDAGGGGVRDKIAAYAVIYREALAADQACLCGMLASEVSILPDAVRKGVTRFFERNLAWLRAVLSQEKGSAKSAGRQGSAHVNAEASLILGSLQGALFVARSLNKPEMFEDAVRGVLEGLSAREA